MSDSNGIIGITRWLKEMDERQYSYSESTPQERTEHWRYTERAILHHFPALASALLIAVTALEKIEQKADKGHAHPEMTDIVVLCADARREIHALPAV